MKMNRRLLAVGTAIGALTAGGIGVAYGVGGDSEEQATGPEADRAKQAAVEAVGGGRVVGAERDDGADGAWEVEIARPDGKQVEVHLNRNLEQVGVQGDDDGRNDRDEGAGKED